jgi:hypothetical protein
MNIRNSRPLLVLIPLALLAAADEQWKDKPAAQWTEHDAQAILSDSPWAKQVVPAVENSSNGHQRSRVGTGGTGGSGAGIPGIRIGGIGIGGMGGPRMGGRGGGMGRPTSQTDPGTGGSDGSGTKPPTLTVRWESALPVQEAHLKLPDSNGPSIDEDYYTVAVLRLPKRFVRGDVADFEKRLKSQGELKREGKKTIHSSDAKVLDQDDGLTILFKFSRIGEIKPDDKAVEFAAYIGNLQLDQIFELNEMTLGGKLEL